MSSYSGLNERDRATARRIIVKGADVLMAHTQALHYTQDLTARWEGINRQIIPWDKYGRINGKFPKHGDCSSTDTYLLWLALHHHFGLPDKVSFLNWERGNTDSMVPHGKPVHDLSALKVGDQVFYGASVNATEHVTTSLGGRRVFSHGSEGGPYILDVDYRGDRVAVRRYI